MAKLTVLKDDEVVRVIKAYLTLTSAYAEVSMDTQLSIERGIIWMIHSIQFHIEPSANGITALAEVAAAGYESIKMQVTRESESGTLDFQEADLIQSHCMSIGRSAAIGTDAGPLWLYEDSPKVYEYRIPLPYASQSIFFGGQTTTGVDVNIALRIFYTVRSVSDKYFFRVAQALLG